MSSKDRYALGGHTFIYTPGGLQQGTRRSYDTSGMREHYRREFEHLVTPKRELALAENKAAIDLAQSALKTSVLINVGGFVAIQAAVPLFKLDAAAIQWPLLSTGIWFAAGLTVAWIAHGIAFHALALGSDQANAEADAITFTLMEQFNPDQAPRGPRSAQGRKEGASPEAGLRDPAHVRHPAVLGKRGLVFRRSKRRGLHNHWCTAAASAVSGCRDVCSDLQPLIVLAFTMTARPIPKRHRRSYGTEALDEPLAAFPSWFLRIESDRCGKVQMVNEAHARWRDRTLRAILARMRHDGCGGLAGKAELLSGIEGVFSAARCAGSC